MSEQQKVLDRYTIVSAYLNNQTEEAWQALVQAVQERERVDVVFAHKPASRRFYVLPRTLAAEEECQLRRRRVVMGEYLDQEIAAWEAGGFRCAIAIDGQPLEVCRPVADSRERDNR